MAKTISLSLPEDLYQWLKEEAERKEVKVQEVIREALEEIRALRRYCIKRIFRTLERLDEVMDYIEDRIYYNEREC